ncbi:hypothetical protein C8Q77DRAFT_1125635 [Trametes polyzona]|nr:hypothetical protein C8Q77DRAFT_1125635 [Trametes polyzona]
MEYIYVLSSQQGFGSIQATPRISTHPSPLPTRHYTNMATAAVLAPHDVSTTLNYFTSTEGPAANESPYFLVQSIEGKPRTNVRNESYPAVVHDARGKEAEFTLDKNGFQFIKWPSVEHTFDDETRIKEAYYPEVEELLKQVTGAKRVFIFDHTLRRRKPGEPGEESPSNRAPAANVHIDQTYEASVNRVKHHLPKDADRLLKSRVRIINVWRPIANPVAHHPLAVSDWRSLDEKDLVPTRLVYPDREGGVYGVRYNPNHRWYYLADQTPDEVTLIKCYDSEEDKARLTPHTAFEDTTAPKDAPHRQSIEVRALVFDSE